MTDRKSNRREFLQTAAVVGMGLAGDRLVAKESRSSRNYRPPGGFAAPALETVRIGFVGVGLQGGSHVRNFLGIEGVEIVAVCDIDEARAREVAGWVVEDGRPHPHLYTRGDTDYQAVVRPRRRGFGFQRHTVEVACAGLYRGHGDRQAHGSGSTGGLHR